MNVKLSCKMDLRKFPFDVQRCPVQMGVFGYEDSEVKLKWPRSKNSSDGYNPVTVALSSIELNEFIVTDWEGITHRKYTWKLQNTTILEALFTFNRRSTYYVAQIYVPTGFLVIISWFSFWLDQEAVPARVSISITTILTLQTMSSSLGISMPPVSYYKGIDVWLMICHSLVFVSLFEFIFTHNYMKTHQGPGCKIQVQSGGGPEPKLIRMASEGKEVAVRVDKIFRWLTIPLFLICNIVYWIIILS